MLTNDYIRNKLSIKLNLHLSRGSRTEGVISEKLLDKILQDFTGYGKYEIVWDDKNLLPLGLKILPEGVDVIQSGSQYVVLLDGRYERVLFLSQLIEFSISEFRNKVLKDLLK